MAVDFEGGWGARERERERDKHLVMPSCRPENLTCFRLGTFFLAHQALPRVRPATGLVPFALGFLHRNCCTSFLSTTSVQSLF